MLEPLILLVICRGGLAMHPVDPACSCAACLRTVRARSTRGSITPVSCCAADQCMVIVDGRKGLLCPENELLHIHLKRKLSYIQPRKLEATAQQRRVP